MASDSRREVIGLLLFFGAIVITLMYYLPAAVTGIAGSFLRSLGFGLIGSAAFMIPVFLFYASIDYFLEKRQGVAPLRVRSVIVLMICCASLFACFTNDFEYISTLCVNPKTGSSEAFKAISLLWRAGSNSSLITNPATKGVVLSGGLIGSGAALSLYSICGRLVSSVALIAFTLSQLILIFRISLKNTAKKTAKAIGNVTSHAYNNVRQYRRQTTPPSLYPTGGPRMGSMPSTSSSSPFVVSPRTEVYDIPVFEADPFNSKKMPVDSKTGFIDTSNIPSNGNSNDGRLKYGERIVDSEIPEGANADFSYTAEPKNPPYYQKGEMKVPSFLKKEPQLDFYDLSDTPDKKVSDTVRDSQEDIGENIYEIEDDDSESAAYQEDYPDSYEPGRVRVPQVDPSVFSKISQRDGVRADIGHIPGGVAGSLAVVPDAGVHDIKINASEPETQGFSSTEGRIIDTNTTVRSANPDFGTASQSDGDSRRRRQVGPYRPASSRLLAPEPPRRNANNDEQLKAKGIKLEESLRAFGIDAKVINITHGPAITRFELTLATGIKVSRVLSLQEDIKLAMAALAVRIEAPIPGKSAIGIEIPNEKTTAVHLRGLLETEEYIKSTPLTVALGRDIPGKPILCDLAKMPHLLIAGSTGSGKSVCINAILTSILCKASPDEVRLILIDPKVVELSVYNGIPHLIMPVVTDPKKASGTLKWAVLEMTRRYSLFAENSVRDISGYNEYLKYNGEKPLPLILIVIDELADLMTVAAKEVEEQISRLAAMARAAGLHLLIATQRPSVDVITGVIKANVPSRIAFAVSSGVDSRTILDSVGAEKLLGKGDMLYAPLSAPKPVRGQGAFVSDKEVETIVTYLRKNYGAYYDESIIKSINDAVVNGNTGNTLPGASDNSGSDDDELLEQAVDIVIDAKVASVSILQRRLGIGYPRAARLIDVMEQKHYIGPFEGSKPRKVLINSTDWLEIKSKGKG